MLEIEPFHLFVVVLTVRLHTITYLQLSAVGGVTDGEIRVSGAPKNSQSNRRMGGIQNRSGRSVEEKNLLPPP